MLKEIERGTFDYAETFPRSPRARNVKTRAPLKVGEYLETWLKRIEPLVKASTFKDYRNTVNNKLIPKFKRCRLDQITRPKVQDWLVSLGVSQKRAANLISPLRMALLDAVDENLIPTSPLDGWRFRLPLKARNTPPIDPFNADEQAAILDVFETRFRDRTQGRNLLLFAFWTGLMTSELVALEWGDIDWHGSGVAVSRALTQAAKDPEGTKTKAGTRLGKLLPPALDALKSQKAFTYLEGGRVFCNPRNNEPWTGDQAIRKTLWQPALKLAGVRYRKAYQTRHTYASMMLSAGEPLAWVSRQLGHSSVLTTAQVYARWIPDSMPEVGNRAVELFGAGAHQSQMSA